MTDSPKAHVQVAFDELAALTLDPTMPAMQYQESRRFFFAGVLWAITEAERVAGWQDDPTGERAYRHLEAMRTECEEFGRRVQAGEA
jgi:hypothetical protein